MKLCALLAQEELNEILMQFNWQESDLNKEGVLVFSIKQSSDDFNAEWENFLASFEPHCTYHRHEWLSVLSDYSGFELFYFVLKVDNEIVAGVPMLFMKSILFGKNMIAIPYVNYGGVLSYSSKLTLSLLNCINEWAKAKKH